MRIAPFLASVLLALPGTQLRTTLAHLHALGGLYPGGRGQDRQDSEGRLHARLGSVTRRDRWHCKAGGHAIDPGFSNSLVDVGAHVLCMESPWADATAIELTTRLPLALSNPVGNPERFPPWAIVTTARQECELVPGPSMGRIAGLPVTYACAGSGLLLGLPKRGKTWTQAYAPQSGQARSAASPCAQSGGETDGDDADAGIGTRARFQSVGAGVTGTRIHCYRSGVTVSRVRGRWGRCRGLVRLR